MHTQLVLHTDGRAAHNVTDQVQAAVRDSGKTEGMCHVFIQHTSASLTLSENADPDVLRDLESFFLRLVPDGDRTYRHAAEGPDDMPAHIRSVLTQSTLTLPVVDGRCALGTWQGIFLLEHRFAPHTRKILVSVV